MKLNIGSGKDIREGYINSDLSEYEGIDVVHNMNDYPYPFEDNSFDEILCYGVLDYLDNPDRAVKELWRISKNDAIIKIRVGHFAGLAQYGQLVRKKGFSYKSFREYDINEDQCKTHLLKYEFNDNVKFIVTTHLEFGLLHKLMGISFLANKFPKMYEVFFAYIFPARRLFFDLKVIK